MKELSSMSTTFECGVCANDVEGDQFVIDSTPTCIDCVRNAVVPLFYEALKFEAKYPPSWGGGVQLYHEQFAEYFEDYATFKEEWSVQPCRSH
jgi:hypothetical protein